MNLASVRFVQQEQGLSMSLFSLLYSPVACRAARFVRFIRASACLSTMLLLGFGEIRDPEVVDCDLAGDIVCPSLQTQKKSAKALPLY